MSNESQPVGNSSPSPAGDILTGSNSPSSPSPGSQSPPCRWSSIGGFILSFTGLAIIVLAVIYGYIPKEDWKWALGGIAMTTLPVSVIERLGMKLIEKLPTFGGGK